MDPTRANLEQELREQHPELRLHLLDAEAIGAWCATTIPELPGAYDWWEINALDATGTGLTAWICIGNPFDPAYRRAAVHYRAGRFAQTGALRRASYSAAHCAVLERGHVIARHYARFTPDSTDSRSARFSIGARNLRFERDQDGQWTVHIDAPTLHKAMRRLITPTRPDGGRVQGTITLDPMPGITPMSRALLPDSPGGSTHDWLIAVPRAQAAGQLTIHAQGRQPRRIEISKAVGCIDSFRGTGPVGEGLRRFFLASAIFPGGAAIGELVVVRKYIQIAPTLLIFTDNGDVKLMRCDRAPRTSFQRSKWLIGYPLTMTWRHEGQRWTVEHALSGLNESLPCKSLAITRSTLTGVTGPRDELTQSRAPGIIRLIQPARIDSPLWRWWLTVP